MPSAMSLEPHDPELTPREWEFVQHFIRLRNAKAAYRLIAPNAKDLHHSPQALRHNPRVNAEIVYQLKERQRKFAVTNDRIIQELAFLAFNDPLEFFDTDGNILPMHMIPEESRRALGKMDIEELFEMQDGERVYVGRLKKLGITNKIKALAELVKIQGMITDKHEISASEDLAAMLVSARSRVKREHNSDIDVEVLLG